MKYRQDIELYAASGVAAMIPGFQLAIDRLIQTLAEMKEDLATMQGAPRKRGRPPKEAKSNYGWSDDPAERSAEMKRRQAMRKHKLHPRDKEHPEHAAWVAKMRRVQKKRFDGMTVREKKEWQAKLQAGRKPPVKMESAA